ncbi:YadA-like family protein [Sneathia vaginalis]|uniref:YadA-like family protein n=1 Tax=Sneathia vaginalis TaxID=187101 RepID=UPI003F76DF5C
MKNIEKYVKSSLKKKITVNRALIILFMITGSFSMSAQGDYIIKSNALGRNSFAKNGYVFGDNSIVGSKDGKDVDKIKEILGKLKELNDQKKDLEKELRNTTDTEKQAELRIKISEKELEITKEENKLLGIVPDGGNNSYAIGNETTTLGKNTFTIGDKSYTKGDKTYSLGDKNEVYGDSNQVHGNNNKVGTEEKTIKGNLVFGNDNKVYSETLTSSGTEHGSGKFVPQTPKAKYNENEIFGNKNKVYGDENISFGSNNIIGTDKKKVEKNIVLGSNVTIDGISNAIVFGDKSTAVKDAVSFGNDKKQRKLKFVAKGTDKTDAVNVEQLDDYAKKEELSKYLKSEDVDVKSANNYISVSGTGKKYTLTFNKDELAKDLDLSNNTTLKGKANANADNIDITTWQTKLGNGEIADGNTGLVTGGKVYTELNKKLSDITVAGDTYITATKDTNDKSKYTLAFNKEKLVNDLDLSNNATLKGKANANADNIDITTWQTKLGNGEIADGNTGLVTGGKVYTELNKKLSDITVAGDTYITATKDTNDKSKYTLAFNKEKLVNDLDLSNNATLKGKANANADNIDITTWQTKLGNGEIADGNTGLVTGGKVYTELNKKLSDITVAGDTYITATKDTNDKSKYTLAFNKEKLVNDLDLSNNATLKGKANANADNIDITTWQTKLGNGEIADGNTGLVTGGKVYTELNKKLSDITVAGDTYITATKDTNDKSKYTLAFNKEKLVNDLDLSNNATLKGKANANADNIDITTWQTKLGNGEIADGNTGLVTGGKVYTELNKKLSDITVAGDTYITATKDTNDKSKYTLAFNKEKLVNDLDLSNNATLKGKANANADNIDITTWQTKLGNGEIADGNTGLVTGGKVYTELNKKLSDITVAGDTYITATKDTNDKSKYTLAFNKEKLVNDLDLSNNATLKGKANANADNIDITTWQTKLGNGEIADGNTGLVTGGKVYTELNKKLSDITVAGDTYITATKDTNDKSKYTLAFNKEKLVNDLDLSNNATLKGKANANADNIDITTWQTKLGNGEIADGNTGLVTGGKVYTELNKKLSDITVAGDTYITATKDTNDKSKYTLAFNKEKLVNDLDLSNNATLKGKANANADNIDITTWQTKLGNGEIADGNTGLVTGGKVYTELNKKLSDITVAGDTYITATKDTNDKSKYTLAFNKEKLVNDLDLSNNATLKGKANANADNIDITTWQTKLGNGEIADGNTGLVTGGKVYTELNKKLDIDAKNITDDGVATLTTKLGTGEIKDNNNNLVTGGTVKKYITEEINNINTKVSGKLSSEDVDVKGDEYITVNKDVQKPNHYSLVFDKDKLATDLDLSKNTKLTEQFNKYALLDGSNLESNEFNLNVWQNKLGNGKIVSGNTGLVKGGDIFTYVNNIKQELNNQATQDLSNKLDKDGTNLDDASIVKLTNKLSEGSDLTTPTNRLVTDTKVGEALKGKLDINANNLTTEGETNLINKLSKDSDISEPNNRLVTDTQVNEHLKNNYYNKADVDAKVSNISNTVVETNKKSELALGGVANAVAMANLVQVNSYSKHRHNLSAAYGYYGGAHALAVGFSGTNEERNFVYKLSGSVNNKGNLAFGVGAGVMLGEENDYIESTEVKKLKETVKEQRDKISNLEKKLDEVLKLIKK